MSEPLTNFRPGGATFDAALDAERLGEQMRGVFDLMKDGAWRTLREISDATGYPEASISARLRDINKPEHPINQAGWRMKSGRFGDGGTWVYKVLRELVEVEAKQDELFDVEVEKQGPLRPWEV